MRSNTQEHTDPVDDRKSTHMDTRDLDFLLKAAAEADWTDVVRRCAWCGRIADQHGRYRVATVVDASTVFTDGMCPRYGARGMALARGRAMKLTPDAQHRMAA
jgi:hypothetical protein